MSEFLSFYIQKGSVGKSTSTNVVALELCTRKFDLLVLDIDRQGLLVKSREKEVTILKDVESACDNPLNFNNPYQEVDKNDFNLYKNYSFFVNKFGWKTYDIKSIDFSDPNSIQDSIPLIHGNQKYDVAFIDFPSVLEENTMEFLPYLQYVFIPVNFSEYDSMLSVEFYKIIYRINNQGVKWLFSCYNVQQANKFNQTEEYSSKEFNASFFKTRIPKKSFSSSRNYNSLITITQRYNISTQEVAANPSFDDIKNLTAEISELIG